MSSRGHIILGLAAALSLSMLGPGKAAAPVAAADAAALRAEVAELRRSGRQAEAAQLLEVWLERYPQDEHAYLQLGQFHADRGDARQALVTWRQLLRRVPGRPDLYRTVSRRCQRAGMDEQALLILLEGREQLDAEDGFSWDIAKLHLDAGRIEAGVQAMLEYLSTKPRHLHIVDDHLRSWVGRHDDDSAAGSGRAASALLLRSLEGAARTSLVAGQDSKEIDPVAAAKLVAGVAIEAGLPDRALAQMMAIRDLPGAPAAIEQLALLAESAGYQDQAFQAYSLLLAQNQDSPHRRRAQLRQGLLLASRGQLEEAEATYLSLARLAGRQPDGAQALYRAAQLQLESRDDPRAAAATLGELLDSHRDGSWFQPALALSAECALRLDDLDGYAARLRELRARAPDDTGVRLELALLAFYRADFDAAATGLDSLALLDPGADLANDALRLLLLIEDHSREPEALSMFARARLRERQRRPDEAAAAWSWLAANASDPLRENSLLAQARLRERETPAEALALYEEMLASFPQGRAVLAAQLGRARVLEQVGRGPEALRVYETVLLQFPADPAAPQIRLDVQRLRRQWRPGGEIEG